MIKFITSIVEWALKGVPYLCIMETILLVYLYIKRSKIFEKQKSEVNNEEGQSNIYIDLERKHSLLKLHMKDVLCIACFLGAVFLTEKLSDADRFGEMLSFAGTVSSIILSIVAIFMSINGEGKNDEIRREMSNSSNKLEETANELDSYLENMLNRIKDLERRVEDVHEDTTNLKKSAILIKTGSENLEKNKMNSFNNWEQRDKE